MNIDKLKYIKHLNNYYLKLNMKEAEIIPFEDHIKKLFLKEPKLLIAELFPFLTRPDKSRFFDLFEKEKNDNSNDSNINNFTKKKINKKNKGNQMELNLLEIMNGTDKRTSLMIKNIPTTNDELKVVQWLYSLTKLNYVFVPKDEKSNKILGFAFINVCDSFNILDLLQKIKIYQNSNFSSKKIEVCYSYKQGLKSLLNSFGFAYI